MGKSSAGGQQGTPGTSTVINQSSPPQAFLDAYTNLVGRAQAQSNAPLQQYQGQIVAPFQPQQVSAFNEVNNLQGAYQPYLQAAAQQFSNATQPLWQSLPSFDTTSLPGSGINSLSSASGYGANAAQPININPFTGLATGAAIGAGLNAPQYANMATGAAFGLDTSQQQNVAMGAAAGLGQAVPQYANMATGAAYGLNTAPQQNVALQAAQGIGSSVPQYANFATQAARGANVAPYQNLATKPLVTQGYGALPQYLSPYTQNVTSALTGLFNQQNAEQFNQIRGNAAAQGALGGDREAIAEAVAGRQQQLAQSPVLAQTLQQGFQGAQQALSQQQQLQLQQGVSQGQLGLGAGQLGVSGAGTQGQIGLGAGQLLSQAGGTQGQLGLGAGQLANQTAGQQIQAAINSGQLLTQAGTAQGQLGLGAGQLANTTAGQQIQAGLGAGQLLNQAAGTQGQLGLGAAGATTQAAGTQGQLSLGAGQLANQTGQAQFNEFNQQQQAQLAAEQQNAWLSSQVGFGLANLGQEQQNLGLSGAAAQQQAGALQQQQAQQNLNVPFQQFLQQQAFPYQQINWLAPIAEGLGAGAGGNAATTSPGPSPISQVAGLGLTGTGLIGATGGFGSNGWLTGNSGLLGGLLSGGAGLSAAQAGAASGFGDAFGAGALDLGALAFAKRGGRIGHDIGGGVQPINPDLGLGILPSDTRFGLDYMKAPQAHGMGAGVPKPPQGSQPQNFDTDINSILKSINAYQGVKKMVDIGSPQGEARGGPALPHLAHGFRSHVALPAPGNAPHLGAISSGFAERSPAIGGFQSGGSTIDLSAVAPLSGTSPNTQTFYQQLTQMPMEKLQEMSFQVPPASEQGKLIQRALQAKRMTPQTGASSAPLTLDGSNGLSLSFDGGGAVPMGWQGLQHRAPALQAPLGLAFPSLVNAQNPLANLPTPNASLPTSIPRATDALSNIQRPQASLPTFSPNARSALAGVAQPTPILPTAIAQPGQSAGLASTPAPIGIPNFGAPASIAPAAPVRASPGAPTNPSLPFGLSVLNPAANNTGLGDIAANVGTPPIPTPAPPSAPAPAPPPSPAPSVATAAAQPGPLEHISSLSQEANQPSPIPSTPGQEFTVGGNTYVATGGGGYQDLNRIGNNVDVGSGSDKRGGFIRQHREEGGGLADDPTQDLLAPRPRHPGTQVLPQGLAAAAEATLAADRGLAATYQPPLTPSPTPTSAPTPTVAAQPSAPPEANVSTPVPRGVDLNKAAESVAIPIGEGDTTAQPATAAATQTATPAQAAAAPPSPQAAGEKDMLLPTAPSVARTGYRSQEMMSVPPGTSPQGNFAGHNFGNMKSTDGGWLRFGDPEQGTQAISDWLQRHFAGGQTTIRQLIDDPHRGYAPSLDPGNAGKHLPEEASRIVGIGPDDPIDMTNPQVRSLMVKAILTQEGAPKVAFQTAAAGGPGGIAAAGQQPGSGSGAPDTLQRPGMQPSAVRIGDISASNVAAAPHDPRNTDILKSNWMLPLTVGAGMLASRSPWPGVALGEGLLTGTHFLGQQQERDTRADLAEQRVAYQNEITSLRGQSIENQAKHMADWMEKARMDNQTKQERDAERASYQAKMAEAATQRARTNTLLGMQNSQKPLNWYVPGTNQSGHSSWNWEKMQYEGIPENAVVKAPPSSMMTGQRGIMNILMEPGPNGEPPAADSPAEALAIMKDPTGQGRQHLEQAAQHSAQNTWASNVENMGKSDAERIGYVNRETKRLLGQLSTGSAQATATHSTAATPPTATAPAGPPSDAVKKLQAAPSQENQMWFDKTFGTGAAARALGAP